MERKVPDIFCLPCSSREISLLHCWCRDRTGCGQSAGSRPRSLGRPFHRVPCVPIPPLPGWPSGAVVHENQLLQFVFAFPRPCCGCHRSTRSTRAASEISLPVIDFSSRAVRRTETIGETSRFGERDQPRTVTAGYRADGPCPGWSPLTPDSA